MNHVQLTEHVMIKGEPVAPGVYPADTFSPESTEFLTLCGFLVPAADPAAAPEPVEPKPTLDVKSLRTKRATKNAPTATE